VKRLLQNIEMLDDATLYRGLQARFCFYQKVIPRWKAFVLPLYTPLPKFKFTLKRRNSDPCEYRHAHSLKLVIQFIISGNTAEYAHFFCKMYLPLREKDEMGDK
jgi:hypothetical protein